MRILVAEDESLTAMMLCSVLQNAGHEVHWASSGTQAWEELRGEHSFDLAMLDWSMPGVDGVEICRRMRRQDREHYTYLLLLTGRDLPDEVVEGLRAGADDYVKKPFNAGELLARVEAGARVVTLQNGLLESRDSLRLKATHDDLTGIYNRGAILEHLAMVSREHASFGAHLGAILFDIDHFKGINDTFGHPIGDRVIKHVCEHVRNCLRETDRLGRYGGEEFVVVVPKCDDSTAITIAQRVCDTVSRVPFESALGSIHVTISVGVATALPAEGVDLLGAADAALYRAKRAGRNRVEHVALHRRAV